MKSTKKIIRTALMLFVTALVFTSCSPEDGKDGQDGDTGATGPMGNANVKLFTYGERTFTWQTTYEFDATDEEIEQSLVLAYLNSAGDSEDIWLPVPGPFGYGYTFISKGVFWGSDTEGKYDYVVRLYKPDGSYYNTEITFRKFRIFVVPASTTVSYKTIPGAALKKIYNGYTEEEVRAMSYEEFVDVFDINE